METIIDKLKKLAALAQRGEYGEADNAPTECQQCKRAHNGINGRYCELFSTYVEQRETPYCEIIQFQDNGK